MGRLDPDPEVLQRVHRLLANLGAEVLGEIEVAGRVVYHRLDAAVRAAQEEELQLGPGVQDVAHLLEPIQLPPQHPARVARKWIAVWREHVADDARAARGELLLTVRAEARLPRDGREGVEVRDQEHVGFGDRKSTRLNSSHLVISYAVLCMKNKKPSSAT